MVKDESVSFDEAALLSINANSPDWFYAPMRLITALVYYWIVLPLLGMSAYAFYREEARLYAVLPAILTTEGWCLLPPSKASSSASGALGLRLHRFLILVPERLRRRRLCPGCTLVEYRRSCALSLPLPTRRPPQRDPNQGETAYWGRSLYAASPLEQRTGVLTQASGMLYTISTKAL